ncbi:MAG: peptidase C25, partial [Thermoplasmata archaeon]
KDAVEQWGVKYVMLVGGRHGGVATEKWWCPVRYANVDDNSNWETSFLSDLYFADIYKYDNGNATFEDWDSNGNGKFAEFKMASRDKVDLYPDVYVGRLACRNNYEVQKMVEKIITYETTTYNSDWFRKLVVVGGDSAPMEGDPYYEGEEENKVAIEHMDGFEPVKLWTSTGTLTDSESVINAVNQGCGFLFFDGHGNPMSWATHPPYDENTWIDGLKVQDMKKLTNEGKYPVCVVGGCHNAQFNVSMLNLLKIYKGYEEWYRYVYRGEISPETWAWWLARKFDGGSIATIGFSGLDWFATGDSDGDGVPDCTQYFSGFLNVHFFMEYGDNGLRVLGEIHGHAIADYLNELFPSSEPLDYKSVEEWVLLGDPSLMVGGYP